jgi:hypothetical protein
MLYRHQYGTPWSNVPSRYGSWRNIQVLSSRYGRQGTFARLLQALDGNPDAARLTAWLRDVTGLATQ